jgi:hypothetical protein
LSVTIANSNIPQITAHIRTLSKSYLSVRTLRAGHGASAMARTDRSAQGGAINDEAILAEGLYLVE